VGRELGWVIMVKRSCTPSLRSNIPQTALVAALDTNDFNTYVDRKYPPKKSRINKLY
jgi:hypothetical protein